MNQIKKPLALLFICVLSTALPLYASAAFSIVEPDRTGSLTIQSVAADPENDTTPATGEAADVTGLHPLANISYRVTRVEDDAETPEAASPLAGEGEYSQVKATNEQGTAVFDKLAQGVYLVHQEDNAAVQVKIDDFLVSLPMTNPAGTGWIYDIYVYPKYQLVGVPGIDAFVTQENSRSDSAGLLDTVRWIITAEIPADISGARQYEIPITLHDHLAYTRNSLVLSARDREARKSLKADDDYTLDTTEAGLTVTLTEEGRAALDGFPLLYLELDTVLNIPQEEMAESLGAPIGIDAALRYTSSVQTSHTSPLSGHAPYVYTGGINILQLQSTGIQPVAGASYKLYRSLSDAISASNAVSIPGGTADWIVTTNGDGAAAFSGLSYGGPDIPHDEGSFPYYLVQTQAPAGYNLLRAPVEVTVDAVSHLESNEVVVRSRSGFLLPATGGMGTFWFTVAGLVLIGIAALCYWRAHRKNNRRTGRS